MEEKIMRKHRKGNCFIFSAEMHIFCVNIVSTQIRRKANEKF